MNDRELLELAAKAAGIKINKARQAERDEAGGSRLGGLWTTTTTNWNPLSDNGYALQLAVKLGLQIFPDDMRDKSVALVQTNDDGIYCAECYEDDGCEAVRLAIVRVAAEIGKAMP